VAYCLDEVVHSFGSGIDSHLNGMKKGKTEKQETFEGRKHREFLRMLDMADEIKYASPVATK
jgi:hypothetical protein